MRLKKHPEYRPVIVTIPAPTAISRRRGRRWCWWRSEGLHSGLSSPRVWFVSLLNVPRPIDSLKREKAVSQSDVKLADCLHVVNFIRCFITIIKSELIVVGSVAFCIWVLHVKPFLHVCSQGRKHLFFCCGAFWSPCRACVKAKFHGCSQTCFYRQAINWWHHRRLRGLLGYSIHD